MKNVILRILPHMRGKSFNSLGQKYQIFKNEYTSKKDEKLPKSVNNIIYYLQRATLCLICSLLIYLIVDYRMRR